MSWSGGGVSFSGGPSVYSVSYSDPSFNFPAGTQYGQVDITSAGPGSVSCGNSVSQSYQAWWYDQYGAYFSSSTSISGTAPSCPPPPPPSYPPSWTDLTLAVFTATVAYSDGVQATNMNYSGSYSVSTGQLPSGITLSPTTGAVYGTPNLPGQNYNFTIAASNSYGTITANFSGTVNQAPTAGKVRIYNGTSWGIGAVKVYNNGVWVSGETFVYNGSQWVRSA